MITLLKPDFEFEDERGCLVQLVHEGYRQVNMCFSKKGAERGGHYHKLNREIFYIISGELTITAEKDGKKEAYDFGKGAMFAVEKNTVHSLAFHKDTAMIVMYGMGVERAGGAKDIISV